MLTLSNINEMTNSHDGDIYSDLYKDVYGSRPRGATFASIEAFDEDFKFLMKQLNEAIKQEEEDQRRAVTLFEIRLNEIMYLVNDTDRVNAIRLLAQAEGYEEDLEWYGYEKVEFEFNLPYGYIKNTL